MNEHVTGSLDQTIAAAVTARIEAEVAKALCGDEVLGRYVVAALTQEVEVSGDYARRQKTTVLKQALDAAITEATKAALAKVVGEEAGRIEAEVRKCLRSNLASIAKDLTKSVTKAAQSPYGVRVELTYPSS